jgi:hypothetical protein|tara:strand:+ start:526 stop:747 length:222 start_codon:yes stop_codon:yes gene_type:complete
VRLAFFYGAVFALIGIYLPFWPVWLAAKGMEFLWRWNVDTIAMDSKVIWEMSVCKKLKTSSFLRCETPSLIHF